MPILARRVRAGLQAHEPIEGQALDPLIPPAGLPLERLHELGMPLADVLSAARETQMVGSNGRVKVL